MSAPTDVAGLLAAGWGVTGVTGFEVLKPARVWRVETGDGAYVLKTWGMRDAGLEERVGFYQAVMAHVGGLGIAVERAVPSVGGGLIHRRDGEAWWLVRKLPNDPRPLSGDESEELQRGYGRAIAELHRALASYPIEDARRRTWRKALRDEILSQSLPTIRSRLADGDRARFEAAVAPHERELDQRLDELPEQLVFYDCHHGNILRVGARVSGFVDADHLSIGMRIWDIAYLTVQGILDVDRVGPAEWSRCAWLVVDAYHRANPLESRELAAIWQVMVAFKLSMLAGVLGGSGLDEVPTLLAGLERLHRVRGHFP